MNHPSSNHHPFDWGHAYPSVRMPVFARNVVATSQPLAAQAGLRMLAAGGNAVDAAIAAAAALTITEPVSNGLGSDAFCIVWDGKTLHGLNASGSAPAAWSVDYYRKKYGSASNGLPIRPERGWDSVTVPGAVAAWAALHKKMGKLPFEDLLQPAIDYAEHGHLISPIVQHKWAAGAPMLAQQAGFSQAFMPRGRAPQVGELWKFPDAAAGLKLIAKSYGEAFYRGEIAAALAAHARENGGAMTEQDLAHYQPEWVTPIQRSFNARDGKAYALHEIPPNGQGIAALIALGILDKLGIADQPLDSVDSLHLQIEAMKLAFADVYHYVADARHMHVTPEQMLDDAYLSARAKLINPQRAQDCVPGKLPSGGTIYLTAADANGMMVSFIQSNYMGFGSGVVVPGVGVSLQNRGVGFSLDAHSPNVVAGGKRPFHTIIPAFLTHKEQPVMSFGVMGGNMQPQGHLQTLVRMLAYGQHPQAACDAPRWKFNHGLSVDVEAALPDAVKQGLAARGHKLESIADPYMDFGSGQFIWKTEGGYIAASDSRRDGQAVGF